ncbi:hypothetical protein IGI57_002474 [Enterococcus sp. DIV0213j]|uniref:phage holin n=1 Tax=Enterococcus sp. DIV0213j TaxID=2774649 RepID=UPI003D2BBD9E
MILPDKYYTILKWVALTVLPAFAVFVSTVGSSLGWEYTNIVVTIINAVTAFLGATIGVSAANSNKKEKMNEKEN